MIDNAMEDMAQKNKVTLSEYRESLINKGIDYNAYRDVIKEEIITRQVQRRVVSEKIKVSKKEIEDFIKHQSHVFKENNKYKISNILISLTETPSISEKNEAVKKIKMIKNKFSNGESFSSLAKNYSDSGNAMTGGDLGWRKLSEIPKIFLKELETLKKGSVSEIIETLNGYYICYLEDKKEITNINIQEVKARHVLIKRTAIVSDNEAKEKLIELKIRIENGESFSDVARAHSDDTMSAASGGILEWTNPGSFVPAFEDKVTSLPLNKISEPFTTQFGWHILEVLGRRDQDNTEIIMQNLARQYITSSRTREVIDAWFIELKEQNFIKYVSENNKKNQRNINLKKRDLKNTNSWDPFSE
jgi:peptidyl-prolyl cis-trans isomerase SurA